MCLLETLHAEDVLDRREDHLLKDLARPYPLILEEVLRAKVL